MLELLKSAAKVSARTESQAYPQNILSFTLDYQGRPDVVAERQKIERILGGSGFNLFPYSLEDDPQLLILQFPTVAREQSPDYLFEEAQALRDALNIQSVTPDIDPPYSDVLTTPPGTEAVGDLIWKLCTTTDPPVEDAGWARKMIRADKVAAKFGVSGAGVRVGQPDSGVAAHREIAKGIDKSLGFNFVDGVQDPTDPLLKTMKSPGHGTSTSSLVASRVSHVVVGSAPGATLIPIRCLDSVIITSGTSVAKAIDHARAQGCRVVTMSLGGIFAGSALRRAVARAAAADMILLAAAGNCVGFVTYPAWDPNVIAVAGINKDKKKWKGSSSGEKVDVAAPGENVHVARRLPAPMGHQPTPAELADVNDRGQGTSFAVALTAGVAALWIERFGFAAIQRAARQRDTVVHELFRTALKQTAQTPPGWDVNKMGAGIVDAEALLGLSLTAIVRPTHVESANPALAEFGEDFEGTPFAAEASFVAADWSLRRQTEVVPTIERALPAQPSPQFAARILKKPPTGLPSPALLLSPATPPVEIDLALRRLAVGRRGQFESAGSIDVDGALETIRAEGSQSILDIAERALSARKEKAPDKVDAGLQQEALGKMGQALARLVDPNADDAMSAPETRVVLEALVKLTGRPAIRVHADGSEIFDPQLGDWQTDLVPTRARWQRLTDAVGRIDVEVEPGKWAHAGTGFHITDGHVMTNRHVLDTFAEPLPALAGEQRFLMRRRASIIFDPEATNEATRYMIPRVVTAGKNRIGRTVDLTSLDMAVVAIEPHNGHGAPPAAIERAAVSLTDPALSRLLVAGYPAKPSANQAPDSSDQANFLAFWDRITELYGDDYGVKYMSPGLVLARPGEVGGDPVSWVFTHDATTLPGNSGSAIIALHGKMQFCGLHFGGQTLSMNLAHDIAAVFATGDGVFSTAFLNKTGG